MFLTENIYCVSSAYIDGGNSAATTATATAGADIGDFFTVILIGSNVAVNTLLAGLWLT